MSLATDSTAKGFPFSGRFSDAIDALKAAATAAVGLDDFGAEVEYLPGLRKLLQAIDDDVTLTPGGRQIAFGVVLGPLLSRLHAHAGWKQRPDCLTQPLSAPVIILGMPRTGTTALYHLLSLDPQFQVPELWLIDTPMPRPPRETWESHPAFQQCAAAIDALHAAAPGFLNVHPRGADLGDECIDILKHCYITNMWGTFFPLPSYDTWWPAQDHAPCYRYLRRVLQLIGADDRRRWLLKDPCSILHLPALLETFPDAVLIFTHRDPVETIPSLASMVRSVHSMLLGESANAHGAAAREVEVWSRGTDLMAQAPELAGRRVDVYVKAFQADPLRVVRNIYDRLGLALSTQTESAMRAQVAKDHAQPRPPHRVTLEEFGLDARHIREQFALYIKRFGPFDRMPL